MQELMNKTDRILTLISAGLNRPGLQELGQREQDDLSPRQSLYEKALNSDMLDERLRLDEQGGFGSINRMLPATIAQILYAYRSHSKYNAIVSWAESLGVPLALLLKATNTIVPHVGIFSWISTPKKAKLLRIAQSHIDRIVLMSRHQAALAVEKIGLDVKKIIFLDRPVDQKFWRPLNRTPDTLCSAGREMRDYATLVQAIGELNIRCHIAANPSPYKKDKWVSELNSIGTLPAGVTIGEMNAVELRELYARSHFVVMPILPTDTDNGATVILEAMAMGKAVICSRAEGQRDLVQEGITGLYVPLRDPRALNEAVLYLLEHPEVADRMGKEARCEIEKRHTLDEWITRIKSIIEQVTKENKERR